MEIDRGLIGTPVVDGSGNRIGAAAGILVDPSSLHVGWLLVTLSTDGSAAVLPARRPAPMAPASW
ncbi:MAG: PRC-barrel domain-containing protein [Actinomycetota bacterium]|nr:PRC-barrel domain-containing protein [Actinomycetota bacterium]